MEINIFECRFGKIFDNFTTIGIELFDFFKKFIATIFACQKPSKSSDGCIHSPRGIDARSNLKADNISISFNILVSFQIFSKASRFRIFHLFEAKCRDNAIFIHKRHTIRNRTERRKVNIFGENFLNFSFKF